MVHGALHSNKRANQSNVHHRFTFNRKLRNFTMKLLRLWRFMTALTGLEIPGILSLLSALVESLRIGGDSVVGGGRTSIHRYARQ